MSNYSSYIKPSISRQKYIDKLIPFIDKDIIKVLVGQRRVGKSYMMFQLIKHIVQNNPHAQIIYINKELSDFDFIRDNDDLNEFVSKNSGDQKTYLFIDEIQDIKYFEKSLRNLLATGKYDIYCTWSNAHLLSGDIAGHLSGRSIEVKIYSLSYKEFLSFHKLANDRSTLQKYLKYGGLPYLINLKLEDHIIFEYLRNIYSTILYKDVVSKQNIRNTYFLENLVKYLADNTGSIVSAKKISDFLKSQRTNISPQVVLNYLNHLTNALMIFKVSRADLVGKKIFESSEKYYFEDIGLRNSINGFRQPDISKIIENVVYNHLLIYGFDVNIGVSGNTEIDFVAKKNGEKIYVQVAYLLSEEKTIEREFGNLLKIKDNYPKYVISMDDIQGNTYQGIEQMHLRNFLTDFKY
ncbi:MAG: ATP-binding protein [Bacteroidetes bacterium]|nr:ATP-binding protein [Bacteroidota bacterium]MBL6943686.1 ATP-binding protein [Bacteroidales bacterium]